MKETFIIYPFVIWRTRNGKEEKLAVVWEYDRAVRIFESNKGTTKVTKGNEIVRCSV